MCALGGRGGSATIRPGTGGVWSGRRDLNPRSPAPKAGALPSCATPRSGAAGRRAVDDTWSRGGRRNPRETTRAGRHFANRVMIRYHRHVHGRGRRGRSSMVEPLPSKQITRVRFPSPAPRMIRPGPPTKSGSRAFALPGRPFFESVHALVCTCCGDGVVTQVVRTRVIAWARARARAVVDVEAREAEDGPATRGDARRSSRRRPPGRRRRIWVCPWTPSLPPSSTVGPGLASRPKGRPAHADGLTVAGHHRHNAELLTQARGQGGGGVRLAVDAEDLQR